MAVQITTMVPIEPFHLNEFTPGALHMPFEADIWSSDRKKWKSSFLLWKNHGYTNEGNLVVGYLELEQKEQKGNLVEISFLEKRVHNGGRENIVEGVLTADSANLFAPVAWELSSRFVSQDGEVVPNLSFHQKAEAESDRIILYNNGKRVICDISGKIFHEFGLIRLLYEPVVGISGTEHFLFLENGLIQKPGHVLKEAPELDQLLGEKQLKCIVQFGYGINPVEYYLDENRHLVTAISCFNAKIYNPDAALFYKEFIKGKFKSDIDET